MFTFQALKIGQRIPISIQLFDGATDKFVKASIIKADGSAISGSPFNVPHVSGGLYSLNTQSMPNTEYISVQYKIYNDDEFTVPSEDHSDTLDVFSLAETPSGFDNISGIVSDDLIINGYVESNTLIGTVEECI